MTLDDVVARIGDYTDDAIIVTEAAPIDLPGPAIVWVNPSFTQMTGYTLDEVRGKSPRILQGEDTDRRTLDRIRAALAKWRPLRVELKNYRKDGTPFWVEFSLCPVADETGFYRFWVSIQRETTKRVERERLLSETTRILRSAPIGLGLISADNRVTYANSKLEETVFGKNTPCLDTSYEKWITHAPVDGRTKGGDNNTDWLNEHRAVLFSGTHKIEESIDGAWHEFELRPMEDGEKLLIVTNIEERRKIQERLNQSLRIDAMGKITAGVAHDFNNLLAVVLGNLELLQRTETALEQDKLIEGALDCVLKGRDLTRNLLSYVRRSKVDPTLCNLSDVVEKFMPILERVIPASIEIDTDLQFDAPPILVDQSLLENAVLNLAINARDSMPQGGRLTISVQHIQASPKSRNDGAKTGSDITVLTVKDTGSGISDENLSNVTEPFFTTKEVGKGSGLGLSMVHGFVEQSGGELIIKSKLGQGTEMSLRFPS